MRKPDTCCCGHLQDDHDYTGDHFQPAWGACEKDGCDCEQYADDRYDHPAKCTCAECKSGDWSSEDVARGTFAEPGR